MRFCNLPDGCNRGCSLVRSKRHYQTVWNTFQNSARTRRAAKRDYGRWHKGRAEYAAWTIDIQSELVQSRFDVARSHLAGFLLEPYRRQPHVTVFVCGFPGETEQFNDDYTFRRLDRHLQELREAEVAPFEIMIGGINSFTSAPFLEVVDATGGIKRVRAVLSRTHSEVGMGAYVPHVTLGLYADHYETTVVTEKISSFGDVLPIAQSVDQIQLTTYSALEIAGPLAVKYRVNLDAR